MNESPKAVEIEQPSLHDHRALAAIDAAGLYVDERMCDMGADCVGVRIVQGAPWARPVGFALDGDDRVEWCAAFRLADGRIVCEDCAIEWEEAQARPRWQSLEHRASFMEGFVL